MRTAPASLAFPYIFNGVNIFFVKIEAVITCVNYSDYLANTLQENIGHLDGVVVVTSPEDKETKSLCNRLGVHSIDTEVFYEHGDPFNKGRAINLGLAHLRHDDWLLHIDADILLPHRFRNALMMAKLQKDYIYGCDRLETRSYDNWLSHKGKTVPQFNHGCLVYGTKEFPIGSRLIHYHYGYCPIGYFQLWHSSAKRRYPVNQGSAEHTDVLFSVQWPREKRAVLPELYVFHLESEVVPMGHNWRGRKSKHFGPKKTEPNKTYGDK